MIRRPPRSTLDRSSAASDVYKRQKLSEDVGVLYGDNPVAIDQASIDLIKKSAGREVFKIANHKDPYLSLIHISEPTRPY